jgi:hypothetical protein
VAQCRPPCKGQDCQLPEPGAGQQAQLGHGQQTAGETKPIVKSTGSEASTFSPRAS